MFSIKKSFSNCSVCKLLDCPSCILETNCKDDLTQVEVVFVAENPGKEEVGKGFPLIGKAGKRFRKFFNKFGINKMKYLLTNVVLCQTLNPDGTTGNPEDDVINLCKSNCMNIIDICKPKLVVVMGTSPMSAFGIAKSGITNLHGNVIEWNGYKTVVIVHPSFVNRNLNVWEPKFEEAMGNIASMLGSSKVEIQADSHIKSIGKGIFRYKIPKHFYTKDYRLIDIQFLTRTQQVLYIFRDKDNNKVYHKMDDKYVCYQAPKGVDARKIVSYEQLDQILIKYKDKTNLDPQVTYEGDLRITAKHAMDYYHFSEGEAPRKKNNIMFTDIEVDTGDQRVFPSQTESKFPINLISTRYNGINITYILDNKTEPIEKVEGVTFKSFDSEKELLQTFIKDFRLTEPDFISGWNLINFDMEYIFNRLPRVNLRAEKLSKFSEFYIDAKRYICHLPGVVVIDQDYVYKTFTFTKLENYKLGFVAQHELGITKIDLPLPFNEMYWKMLNKTIEYNIRDAEILEKLEDKLAHINLLNELRVICNTSFDSVSSFGQIDSLMVSYLRNKGMASKNSDPHIAKERYSGAFVFEPEAGTYDWITDFDFASLYPNLIVTYNIGVNNLVMRTSDPQLGYDIAYNPSALPNKIKIIYDPLYEKKEMIITPEQLFKKMKELDLVNTINGCFFKPHNKELSVFSEVVDSLMTSRKDYKNKMFNAIEKNDEENEKFYYTRQLVYKVLANTLYGVVANKAFRFFDLSLASAITLGGQEALKTSIVEGDAFMRHLKSGKDYIKPRQLTKKEMFSDEMPDRSNEYIITGDTDSIFCCFQSFEDTSIENINKMCSKIETFLNDKQMSELVKKHNVDLNYNRLVLKNELIISRGLFLAKKRYVIRVVSNEGREVDKTNYMGVEIKRSDYPSKTKDFLSKLLDLLLKTETISLPKLLKYIERARKDFTRTILDGNKSVARPITYGKRLQDYKVIPQGVRAMEAWNKIMYPIHKQGNKAYMFWVRGINFEKITDEKERERIRKNYEEYIASGNKLEVIGVPDEETKLPEYFEPDLKPFLKFSFIDRYELMLKPLVEVKFKADILTI
ncbi:MAG: family B DNA polymerase [Candidatus Thorarchaeota archaeon]